MKKIVNNRLLSLLILVTLVKGLVFSMAVPIWHGPDEQAHFGQIANYAEFGKLPTSEKNLNQEIFQSENLLGTFRDRFGNNSYTFHPEYKIEFTDNLIGKYEYQISSIPQSDRRKLVVNEATAYPPLFYFLGTFVYLIFNSFDLFVRVFMVRIVSILCIVASTVIAYKIGLEIFQKNKLQSLTLATLVSFQPMVSFVGASVNSDNLMTLLFSAGIYLALLMLKNGFRKNYLIASFGVLFLGILSKPQFIMIIPIWGFVYLVRLLKGKRKKGGILVNKLFWAQIIGFLIFIVVATVAVLLNYSNSLQLKSDYSLKPIEFILFTLRHTFREVIPWYWGVFDWLGVVYPIEIIRLINRVLLIAVFGLVLKLFFAIKKKHLQDLWPIFLLIFSSVIYFIGISTFDYLYMVSSHGISIGVQGRYFFPTIIAHMALLLIGLMFLIPRKFKEVGIKIIGLLMICLNLFALFVIFNIYYNLTSWSTFFTEFSQYKPGIYKYPFSMIFLIVYLILLGLFVYKYVHLKQSQND